MGKVKIQAFVIWLQVVLFLLIAFLIFPDVNAAGFATIRLSVIAIGSIMLISVVLFQVRVFSVRSFLSPMGRPALAGITMVMVLNMLYPSLNNLIPFIRLLCEVAAGMAVYSIAIGVMWIFMGRPEGAEAYLIKNILYKQIKLT